MQQTGSPRGSRQESIRAPAPGNGCWLAVDEENEVIHELRNITQFGLPSRAPRRGAGRGACALHRAGGSLPCGRPAPRRRNRLPRSTDFPVPGARTRAGRSLTRHRAGRKEKETRIVAVRAGRGSAPDRERPTELGVRVQHDRIRKTGWLRKSRRADRLRRAASGADGKTSRAERRRPQDRGLACQRWAKPLAAPASSRLCRGAPSMVRTLRQHDHSRGHGSGSSQEGGPGA
jgi:hypothetical protein